MTLEQRAQKLRDGIGWYPGSQGSGRAYNAFEHKAYRGLETALFCSITPHNALLMAVEYCEWMNLKARRG